MVFLRPYQLADLIIIGDSCYDIKLNNFHFIGKISVVNFVRALKQLDNLELNFGFLIINKLSYGIIVCRNESNVSHI